MRCPRDKIRQPQFLIWSKAEIPITLPNLSGGGTPIAVVYVYLPPALEKHAEILKDERVPAETTYSILEQERTDSW